MVDSSKLHSTHPNHGGYGTFIASLSALSLLSITSHHHLHHSHNSISMHRSEVVSRHVPAPVQHYLTSFEYGTRVNIRNLFGSMPVRVKQRAIASENPRINAKLWDSLCKDVVSLLLSWPKKVSVIMKENCTNQKFTIRRSQGISNSGIVGSVDLHSAFSILSKASYINADEKSSWIPVSGSTSSLVLDGAISLIPNPSKNIQFLALGIEPLISQDNSNILYEDINRWFINSTFGSPEETPELDEIEVERRSKDRRYKGDGYTNKELRGCKKGVDRWPMFYINIHQIDEKGSLKWRVDDVLDGKQITLDKILELLRAIVTEFLTRNNFRPRLARGDRTKQASLASSPTDLEGQMQSGPIKSANFDQNSKSCSTTSKYSILRHERSNQKGARPDMLGTKVKLPSFRQTPSGLYYPFEPWSKVKVGTGHSYKPPTDSIENYNFTLPRKTRTIAGSCSTTPLISESGKLMRRPFEEVQAPGLMLQSLMENVEGLYTNGDELAVWINPINKVKSIVNKSTGLVVSNKEEDRKDRNKLVTNMYPRLITAGKPNTADKQSSPWVEDILKRWENPIFAPAGQSIPQVSIDGMDLEAQGIIHGRHHHCSQIQIEKAFKGTSSGLHGSISKEALQNAEIISQVDKKFILAKLQTNSVVKIEPSNLLVIIDQHAADERIRIENLLSDFLIPPKPSSNLRLSSVSTSPLGKHLSFDIPTKDSQLFRNYIEHFSYWGISYSISLTASTLTVHHLPPLITARLLANPSLLLHILRTELYSYHEHPTSHPIITPATTWIERISHIPKGILELLNSRACRSAIMFNDELSIAECRELVRRLANCKLPFICAHGRVSMVPLGELEIMSRQREAANSLEIFDKGKLLSNENRDGEFSSEWGNWVKQRRNKS